DAVVWKDGEPDAENFNQFCVQLRKGKKAENLYLTDENCDSLASALCKLPPTNEEDCLPACETSAVVPSNENIENFGESQNACVEETRRNSSLRVVGNAARQFGNKGGTLLRIANSLQKFIDFDAIMDIWKSAKLSFQFPLVYWRTVADFLKFAGGWRRNLCGRRGGVGIQLVASACVL
ncbi:hypothetical protein B566_EDAN007663, partial [Ephemera danica]